MDKGTLYQLKNVINRTSVPTSPDKNMKAAEDFCWSQYMLTLLLLHMKY